MPRYSRASSIALISLNYLVTILWPVIALVIGYSIYPTPTLAAVVVAAVGWAVYINVDASQYGTGKPDKSFSQQHWMFCRLRE